MISPEDGWSKLPRLAFLHREIDTLFESGFLLGQNYAKIARIVVRLDQYDDLRKAFKRNPTFQRRTRSTTNRKTVNLIKASRAFAGSMERAGELMRPRFKLVIPRKSH